MDLLSSADYPEIRAVLDVSLTSKQLPDDTIAFDTYIGRAERKVAAEVDVASLTGDNLARGKNAVKFYCAAYLAPAIPNIVRKSMGAERSVSLDIDWDARAERLMASAAEELALITSPSATAPLAPTFFTTAQGTRGW